MSKQRLEAFSDGVIAILITIMVLELRTPHGTTWAALREDLPVLLAYVLSFVNIGIYRNNHHHMLAAVSRISGMALWANQHLLFWLSLIPVATAWMSENHFPPIPVAAYGVVLLAPPSHTPYSRPHCCAPRVTAPCWPPRSAPTSREGPPR